MSLLLNHFILVSDLLFNLVHDLLVDLAVVEGCELPFLVKGLEEVDAQLGLLLLLLDNHRGSLGGLRQIAVVLPNFANQIGHVDVSLAPFAQVGELLLVNGFLLHHEFAFGVLHGALDLRLVVLLLDLANLGEGILNFDLVLVGERLENLLLGVFIELEKLIKVEIIFTQYLVQDRRKFIIFLGLLLFLFHLLEILYLLLLLEHGKLLKLLLLLQLKHLLMLFRLLIHIELSQSSLKFLVDDDFELVKIQSLRSNELVYFHVKVREEFILLG